MATDSETNTSSLPTAKQCNRCKQMWPRTTEYFYKCAAHKDGLQNACKSCMKKYQKTRREESGGKKSKKKRKKKRYKDTKRYDYKLHPNRYHARQAIHHLLRHGWLKYRQCDVPECDRVPAKLHHEHYDYPLEVISLCGYHHSIRHKQLRDAGFSRLDKARVIKELEQYEKDNAKS